jgi:hypothetical protein
MLTEAEGENRDATRRPTAEPRDPRGGRTTVQFCHYAGLWRILPNQQAGL